MSMVDTNELRAAIVAAEHKPEDWNVSALTFGAAAKRIDHPPGVSAPLQPWGEEIIGTFPWKRDGWLAVAAVRALPALLDELDRLRAAVNSAEIVPITKQVSYPPLSRVPLDWSEPCFQTTHAKLIPCDADGNLLPAGDSEGPQT